VAKPGPAKGEGGRPRKPEGSRLSKGPLKGYVKITVGPKGKGKQVYKHRHVAGVSSRGRDVVVDHMDGNKSNNSRRNLRVTTRGDNVARANRARKY
jgi:hypothetical protein